MNNLEMKKLFKITAEEIPDIPFTKAEEELETIKKLRAESLSKENSHKLLITANARKQIFKHISWNKYTETNSVEQGGLLLGCTYFDEVQDLMYGIVEIAIPALTAEGSTTYLKFNHATWKKMIDEIDIIIDKSPESNIYVIGWYHTHPGSLPVFMSGTDRNTQLKMFSKYWQFAVVLNPQKKIWKAFNGKDTIECSGYILK